MYTCDGLFTYYLWFYDFPDLRSQTWLLRWAQCRTCVTARHTHTPCRECHNERVCNFRLTQYIITYLSYTTMERTSPPSVNPRSESAQYVARTLTCLWSVDILASQFENVFVPVISVGITSERHPWLDRQPRTRQSGLSKTTRTRPSVCRRRRW